MSSLVRRIQRTTKRADDPACRAPNFRDRGTKLGVVNERDPCRTGKRKKPKAWRDGRTVPDRGPAKASKPGARLSRAEVVENHRAKMGLKLVRRARLPRVVKLATEPTANVSRHHPDADCTPREHARRKAERMS